MFITMIDTLRGSEDGFLVKQFCIGVTYDCADTLARSFIMGGRAREATEEEIANMKAAKVSEVQVLQALVVGIITAVKSGDAVQIIEH